MSFSALRLRAVHAVRKYFRRQLDVEALTNLNDVAPYIRRHLNQLYFTLLCASVSSALGSYLSSNGYIGSSVSALGVFMSIISFYAIAPWKENKRIFLFVLGAFFGGASFAPWFTWFLKVDSGFVVTTVSATSLGFWCFWASSKWINRFDLVYFTAILCYSPLSLIDVLITSSLFGGLSAIWKFQIYAMLLWYMVYVAVYSQEVVVRARRGDADYVKHAVCLFTDFPAVVFTVIRLFKPIRRRNRTIPTPWLSRNIRTPHPV